MGLSLNELEFALAVAHNNDMAKDSPHGGRAFARFPRSLTLSDSHEKAAPVAICCSRSRCLRDTHAGTPRSFLEHLGICCSNASVVVLVLKDWWAGVRTLCVAMILILNPILTWLPHLGDSS
jgi:hypothetical protein